jgi:hypothetical protein
MLYEKLSEKFLGWKNFLHENCKEFNYELNGRTSIQNGDLDLQLRNFKVLLGELTSTICVPIDHYTDVNWSNMHHQI